MRWFKAWLNDRSTGVKPEATLILVLIVALILGFIRLFGW